MKIHGTAKGGAISKKNFGVAFGGAAPAPCNFDYDFKTGEDRGVIGGSYSQYAIRNVTGTDTTVTTANWYFGKHASGSPTGNAVAKLYNTDGTTLEATSDTVDVSGITSTSGIGQPLTFTFSPAVTWVDDYYLAVEYTVGGDRLTTVNSYPNAGSTDFTYHYWVDASSSWTTMSWALNCVTACS